jgi:hypothetical protein
MRYSAMYAPHGFRFHSPPSPCYIFVMKKILTAILFLLVLAIPATALAEHHHRVHNHSKKYHHTHHYNHHRPHHHA